MMVIVGTWLFGSYKAGRAFMLVQAFTVFLALDGTRHFRVCRRARA